MRKYISLVLSIIMVFSAFSVLSVSAKETNVQKIGASSGITGDCKWKYDDSTNTLTISGNGEMENYDYLTSAPWHGDDYTINSVVIGNGVTTIGDYAFDDCTNLVDVTIPESVRKIGEYAFCNCYSLTDTSNIKIPDSVLSIGDYAFFDCTNLINITIPKMVMKIGDCVFRDCYSLTDINVDKNNMGFSSYDGNLYNKNGTTLYNYAIGKTDTIFEVPSDVIKIEKYAFSSCGSLTDIIISDGVREICENAFSYCENLTNITMPNSVTKIGDESFAGCGNLSEITISNNVKEIGERLFFNCYSLTRITLPNKLVTINDSSFRFCDGLTSITIPTGVKQIGDYAFDGCEKLKNVYYKDTRSKWRKIKIGTNNSCLTKSNIHYKNEPQTISAKSFNKYYGDKQFYLGAKAKTKLSYKTSNKNVATVDSKGKVTIKEVGKATITITAKSSLIYKSATKKITINVALKPLPNKSIKVKKTNKSTINVSWPKVAKVNGYQVEVSMRVRGMSLVNSRNIAKTNVTLTNAKKGQKIKLSVRTYKKVRGNIYYSGWTTKNIVVK